MNADRKDFLILLSSIKFHEDFNHSIITSLQRQAVFFFQYEIILLVFWFTSHKYCFSELCLITSFCLQSVRQDNFIFLISPKMERLWGNSMYARYLFEWSFFKFFDGTKLVANGVKCSWHCNKDFEISNLFLHVSI
ncbi:hypothetical protein P9112_003857 [Eukaryota sp. TZLM1-RC]